MFAAGARCGPLYGTDAVWIHSTSDAPVYEVADAASANRRI